MIFYNKGKELHSMWDSPPYNLKMFRFFFKIPTTPSFHFRTNWMNMKENEEMSLLFMSICVRNRHITEHMGASCISEKSSKH